MSWKSDGFVFGLEGSGLERPKGKIAITVVEGDSLETKPYQVALVSVTFLVQAICLAMAISNLFSEYNGNTSFMALVQIIALIGSSYILADFGSGVLHWSVDNYGNGNTPIMGGIIAAFQGHHAAPWTICQRGFCNNVYKLCLPFGIVPTLAIFAWAPPAVAIFAITFCMFEILSQEFHKWSHQTKGEASTLANALQNMGITVPRTQHALHHVAPYDGNYCIISGICNQPLDDSGIFRWMEHVIYQWNGVESNAWKLNGELRARTLAGDYRLVNTFAKPK
jgi:palmitoyl-[glycerolipid] 3-(E)-desaturase